MNLKKFGNFNWIEMDSKDQNLDLIRTKRIHFSPFQSIFICWGLIALRFCICHGLNTYEY